MVEEQFPEEYWNRKKQNLYFETSKLLSNAKAKIDESTAKIKKLSTTKLAITKRLIKKSKKFMKSKRNEKVSLKTNKMKKPFKRTSNSPNEHLSKKLKCNDKIESAIMQVTDNLELTPHNNVLENNILENIIVCEDFSTDKNNDISKQDVNEFVQAKHGSYSSSINLSIKEVLFNKTTLYPQHFPNIRTELGGLILTKEDYSTLKPYKSNRQYLNDNIINVLFILLSEFARENGLPMICFDTHFITKIQNNGHPSDGFKKWAMKNSVWNTGLWLIPINHNNVHWTMFIVLINQKVIINIESMHNVTNTNKLNNLCNFIQTGFNDNIKWEEWTLYEAQDVPHQYRKEKGIRGNCGVHIAVWAYITATGTLRRFSENDMDIVRKNIAHLLATSHVSVNQIKKIMQNRDTLYSPTFTPIADNGKMKPDERINMTCSPVLGFDNIFDLCASLKVIIESSSAVAVTRKRNTKQ